MKLSVTKLAVAVIAFVAISSAAWLLYLNHRMERFMASQRPAAAESRDEPVYSSPVTPATPEVALPDPDPEAMAEADAHNIFPESDVDNELEAFLSEPEVYVPDTVDETPSAPVIQERLVPFEEGRRHFLAEHGDTPEARRYLDLLKMNFDGATMTKPELLEYYRLHAHYVPEPENIELYELFKALSENRLPE